MLSAIFMETGRVAALEEVEAATMMASAIFLNRRIGLTRPRTAAIMGSIRNMTSRQHTQSVVMKTMTCFIMLALIVVTMSAIRAMMPMGEKAMTYSVIFSIASAPWSTRSTRRFTRSPSTSKTQPIKMAKKMI